MTVSCLVADPRRDLKRPRSARPEYLRDTAGRLTEAGVVRSPLYPDRFEAL